MSFLVDSPTPITLVGGGPVDGDLLRQAVALAPMVVAADGGFNRAHALGQKVDHVIGDMDSVDASLGGAEFHPIAEQMTTDLDKCLYATNAPFYLGVGFLGGRLDHQLAACHTLTRAANKRVILLGEQDLCFLAPQDLTLNLPLGARLSLFPMGAVSGTSKGLEWPIDGQEFSPDAKIGTSNRVTGKIRLTFESQKMLVVLPIELLEVMISCVR